MKAKSVLKAAAALASAGVVGYIIIYSRNRWSSEAVHLPLPDDVLRPIPSRRENLASLEKGKFDILVIGGGATGCGIALDAALRGLQCALIERDDFSSGTSSRSTKLIHGGVRYLEKAFWKLDYGQFKLVKEALHERATLMHIAPHNGQPIPIAIPVYKWWELPYYYGGSKMYDLVASLSRVPQPVPPSHYNFPSESLYLLPSLRRDGLKGTIVYYDGKHNDSRMNVMLALTAAGKGATVLNHTEVVSLAKSPEGKVTGARVRDTLTGQEVDVTASVIVNAAGPFVDKVLKMDDSATADLVAASSGVHVVLPPQYCRNETGIIIPKTSDGRVLFLLPWEGMVLAGTTDEKSPISYEPRATAAEVDWILNELGTYVTNPPTRADVTSVWSGLRPLVQPRHKSTASTADIIRDHVIVSSDSGLITVTGGKWTTYRRMAEEVVDKALNDAPITAHQRCRSAETMLLGGHTWSRTLAAQLKGKYGIDGATAEHLSCNYGDQSEKLCELMRADPQLRRRLDGQYVFTAAEVVHACRNEYAETAVDVLARRTRLAFLDVNAARGALGATVELMAREKGWTKQRAAAEVARAHHFFDTLSLSHV